MEESQRLLTLAKCFQELSDREKLVLLREWTKSPWYAWAILTLKRLADSERSLTMDLPSSIEQFFAREQAIGEVNGLNQFQSSVKEVLDHLQLAVEEEEVSINNEEQND